MGELRSNKNFKRILKVLYLLGYSRKQKQKGGLRGYLLTSCCNFFLFYFTPGNFTSFFIDHWKFCMLVSLIPIWKFNVYPQLNPHPTTVWNIAHFRKHMEQDRNVHSWTPQPPPSKHSNSSFFWVNHAKLSSKSL